MFEKIYVVDCSHQPCDYPDFPVSFNRKDVADYLHKYCVKVTERTVDKITYTKNDMIVTCGVDEYAFSDFNRWVFLDEDSAEARAHKLWDDLQPDEWPEFVRYGRGVPWWAVRPPDKFAVMSGSEIKKTLTVVENRPCGSWMIVATDGTHTSEPGFYDEES